MKPISVSLVLLLATFTAFAQFPPQFEPPPGVSSDAPIGPRDVIEVKVFQDPSLNTRAVVTDDGRVSLPLIGKIEASGLRPAQLEQVIRQKLEAKFIQKADVTVTLIEAGNRPISVIGAVMRPGRIGATGNITLIQAITQAGGLAAGYGKTLYVLRTAANGLSEQLAIDINDLMVNGNPDLNIPLRPNDVINVPVDQMINIYLLGEVMHPGKVQFRRSQSPTLLQALADAGGPTDRASSRCIIKRKANGVDKTIQVDYRKILNGNAPDITLQDDDTIYVRASIF